VIRAEHGLALARFARIIGVPRATYYRRLRRAGAPLGPWPTPAQERIEGRVVETALAWPAWGHRKVWALLAHDGLACAEATVKRVMRRRGLLLPVRYQAERRELAKGRREAFLVPPTRHNRVWQMDFAEHETAGGGTWQFCPLVDYVAKVCLASPATPTKTGPDAVAALAAALAEVERLLGRTLRAECTDPDTGELLPLIIVTDNGACFRSAVFARFIAGRPELRHVRTRIKAPETNGVAERYIGAVKYECLYREQIADGLALQVQLEDYRDLYNRVRPHEAIGFARPLDRYLDDTHDLPLEPKLETARSVSGA
jgi:transposase InsO family protein